MTDVDNTPLTLPEIFLIAARSFTTGAHAIVKSTMRAKYQNDIRFVVPCAMLVGHAIEVYFKAWLSNHDGAYTEIRLSRKPFGHDLRALYKEARSLGFPEPAAPVHHTFHDLVESYETPHGDYTFRYPKDGWSFDVPMDHVLFPILERLDAVVSKKLGKAVPPDLDWSVTSDENFRVIT